MNAFEYMNWCMDAEEEGKSWLEQFAESEYHDDEDITYTLKNIRFLKENAKLMNDKSLQDWKTWRNMMVKEPDLEEER